MIRQHDKDGTTFTGKDSLFDCFATYQTQYSYITKITSLFVKMETRKGIYWVEGVTVQHQVNEFCKASEKKTHSKDIWN